MKKTISAIIIVKDEEQLLPVCLKTLQWVDEIVVVDTGSSDKTVSLARKAGAKVVMYPNGKGFPDWRNKGLKEATGEWIFYIDADERVPEALKKEIQSTIKDLNSAKAYAIPRSNKIFGKEFRHGGWWPDYVKRLYKRNSLHQWVGELHEEPIFDGTMEHLNAHLLHEKHETLFEMVQKTNKWSAIEGKLMFDANHPPMNVPRFMTAMGREFFTRMIKQRAFLDGREGIIMAIYQVFSRFCSYAKLWELQIQKK